MRLRRRARMGRGRRHQKRLLTAGFVGGMLAGMILWSMQMQRCRRDLFSSRPMRRLAALGYLASQRGADTLRLLTEYVRWETNPALRRRGERLVNRLHAAL